MCSPLEPIGNVIIAKRWMRDTEIAGVNTLVHPYIRDAG